MKKLVFLISFVTILFASCSADDDKQEFYLKLLPIQEVVLPDSFELGETYNIKLYYHRPTSCHGFNGIFYDKDLNVRTIAIESIVFDYDNCLPIDEQELTEASFDFRVTSNGSYIFKFWQGKNEAGEDVYLEYEVPVN